MGYHHHCYIVRVYNHRFQEYSLQNAVVEQVLRILMVVQILMISCWEVGLEFHCLINSQELHIRLMVSYQRMDPNNYLLDLQDPHIRRMVNQGVGLDYYLLVDIQYLRILQRAYFTVDHNYHFIISSMGPHSFHHHKVIVDFEDHHSFSYFQGILLVRVKGSTIQTSCTAEVDLDFIHISFD